MGNPYGNNGFNRIQQQQQQRPMQQAGYVDPRFNQQQQMAPQQMQQAGYVDPRFNQQQQMQGQQMYGQPAYGQPAYGQPTYGQQGYVDPRFNQQQMQQQMQMQQRQMMNPMGNQLLSGQQPQFGQPIQGNFGAPPQQSTMGRAISSSVDDVTPNNVTQSNQQPVKQQEPEINVEMFGPADGSEFPPYYNKNTEKLVKIYNKDTFTYTWKIDKIK